MGTRGVLVPGYPCPAQPTTPTSGMCGRGAGSSCGSRVSWAQLSHIRPGPRGEEPGLGRPRSCHEAGGWDPHSSGAQQWRVRGGGASGLGWAWDRGSGSEFGLACPFLPGLGAGRKCERQLPLLFLLPNAFPSSQTLRAWGLMLENP